MKNIKQNSLNRKVLAGLFSISLACGNFIAMPQADAASLYEEYQQEQKIESLKKQIEETKKQLEKAKAEEEKEAKKVAGESKKAESVKTATKNTADVIGDFDPNNVVTRIKAILENKTVSKKITDKAAADVELTTSSITLRPPASAEKPAATTNHEGRYNFDWRGTPLAQSIYGVAKIANKGVVVNSEINGNVYMSLKQVTCDQALNYLASAFGINWMSDGNNIIISTGDLMKQSRTFEVAYANKENLAKEFKSLGISEENIYANSETGTISVTGTPYQLAEAAKRLKSIDHPVSQCMILAQLIEIDHGKTVDLGMSYSLPTYSHVAESTGDGSSLKGPWLDKFTFSASATASRSLSKGKVIARPMILSLNGQKGTVNFGDRVPVLTKTDTGSTNSITVTYQDIGTSLEVTPIINANSGDITLTVTTEVSNITGWQSNGDTRAPQLSTRKATTSTHVKDGQSFVIGGLMSVKELDNLSGIPGLMNLPILGELFKNHNRSKEYAEVFIMITPFIIHDGINPRDVYDELKYIDSRAVKNDVNIPGNDWTKSIGNHKIQHHVNSEEKQK